MRLLLHFLMSLRQIVFLLRLKKIWPDFWKAASSLALPPSMLTLPPSVSHTLSPAHSLIYLKLQPHPHKHTHALTGNYTLAGYVSLSLS